MIKYFLLVLTLLFAVVGLCEFIYVVRVLFFYPGIRSKKYIIIFLQKGYAFKELNFLWQKLKWHGNELSDGIIALTDNIDFEEINACKDFIENKNVILCNCNSLYECSLILQGESFNGNHQ